VGGARTKLTNQIEGQREEIKMEKHQLISMMPGVENEVENHEESVSQLLQETDENKAATKDIVNEFGRRWSVSNHVASLQAEKAVLERTIVGLEEKVQELEEIVRNQDTPRSSVSTVISVDCVRANLSEDDGIFTPGTAFPPESENGEVLSLETGESREATGGLDATNFEDHNKDNDGDYNEAHGNGANEISNEYSNEGSNEGYNEEYNEDYNKLMEKLREYQEMIEEFEVIKEDWEGEKEALESVVVELRQKLKDVAIVEKNQGGKGVEKRYLNDIEELLIKKNYVSEEDLKGDQRTREDMVLSHVLKRLRSENVHEESFVRPENNHNSSSREESIILKQDNNQYYSSPGDDDRFVDELEIPEYNEEGTTVHDGCLGEGNAVSHNELHPSKSELEATRNECSKTKHELDETKHELDETNAKLNEKRNELDKTKLESEKSRADLENARVKLGDANETVTDLQSVLKVLKNELEANHVNFNTTISEKEGEIHKLRNVVEQLQGTLSNFENNKANIVSQLQQEIESLQKELGGATSSRETIATQLEQSQQDLASVVEARDSLGVKLKEMGKQKEELLGMVNDRDARIEELQDLCDSVDQRFSSLQEEGKDRSKAFSELSEENSLLKDEKSDLFNLLETKESELNNSVRESEKLSELLREQELASEEMKRQNSELAKDLENWRMQLEELNQTKETLNRDLDAKSEEIMSLKENNIELANQSYENSAEISQKLSVLEQLVSENLALKSENETFMEALSEKKVSEKEMKDSYNLLAQEKQQLDASFSQKSSEMEQEIRRKIDEVEVLRLEVARLTKESQEKDTTIRAQVSANLVSGSSDDVMAKQEHIRHILAEKDIEIGALRTKNESLLTLFAENEQEKGIVRQEHENQIASMLARQERMFNEINEKNDQIITLEDRLEMLNIKSASKDQASALIHAEHQKLLYLNEAQSEEIGRLREKVTGLGLLVAERDHSASGGLQKLRQRNSDLELQVEALQGEQERLLILVHDKDKQLLNNGQKSPLRRTQELLVNTQPSGDGNRQLLNTVQELPVRRSEEILVNAPPPDLLSQHQDEIRKLAAEKQKLSEEIASLRNNVALLSESIESERNTNTSLAQENDLINQRLKSLEDTHMESGDKLKRLRAEEERLRQELSTKERQILAAKEENNRRVYEINTLQNEKDELISEHNSQVEQLQTKLSSLLDVICSDVDLKDEQFEILENREDFERLVTRVKNHRARLLSDKENEVRFLKEQVETLNSVQNINNPQLEAKLEQFIHEKDLMNQKLTEIENEKLELLELKENEMTSLQTQVVDLSNILKQKERKWLTDKDTFSEKNNLLEKRAQILEQERDSLNKSKVKSESEISRLREEVTTLTASADQKLDVVSHEKDRRVKDLERELDGLKQRYSRSLQEAQDMKSELETARKLAQEFEGKKEKELERLRTHLVQVRISKYQVIGSSLALGDRCELPMS
jgi:chromosome segregation ATPase